MRTKAAMLVPLLLLTAAATGGGQSDRPPVVPPSPPAVAPDPAVVVLALSDLGSRMGVPVSIGGSARYPFVIDTGAQRTVVARELATVLALGAGPRVRLTAMTGTSEVATVIVPRLDVDRAIGAGPIEAPALSGSDLGAPGMLGVDALAANAVDLDFVHHRMTVRASSRHMASAMPGEIVVRGKSRYGQLIITQARYAGKPITVVIDTGSVISIGNTAFHHLVANRTHSVGEVTMRDVAGGTLTTDYAVVDRLTIGGVGLSDLPVGFADVPPFARFDLSGTPALLLGMDALRAFRSVTIDFANRQVRFAMPDGEGPSEPDRWSVAT